MKVSSVLSGALGIDREILFLGKAPGHRHPLPREAKHQRMPTTMLQNDSV